MIYKAPLTIYSALYVPLALSSQNQPIGARASAAKPIGLCSCKNTSYNTARPDMILEVKNQRILIYGEFITLYESYSWVNRVGQSIFTGNFYQNRFCHYFGLSVF